MFKNIIFDFDGTLANTVSSTLDAFRQTFNEFGIFYDETKFNKRLFITPRAEYDKIVNETIPADIYDSVFDRYRKLRNENFRTEAYVYLGIENLLKRLKFNEHNLFIATNSSRSSFSEKLAILFNEIDFNDFRASQGTKPEMVEDLIKTHNLDKSKTVIVGDGAGDINAGKLVGIKTIAVAWGYDDNKDLLKNSADFYVETPEELENLLKI